MGLFFITGSRLSRSMEPPRANPKMRGPHGDTRHGFESAIKETRLKAWDVYLKKMDIKRSVCPADGIGRCF